MAEEQIVQNSIRRLGQSQSDRTARELKDRFVDVDERDSRAQMAFTSRLAPLVRYYGIDNQPDKTWAEFFLAQETDRVFGPGGGNVTPHLALFGAFLGLYETSRAVLNRLTAAHLAFFYQKVLGFAPRPGLPDHAHVLVELKNNTPPLKIGNEHRFSGGKSAQGERLYAPVRDGGVILRHAEVVSLRSIFVNGGRTIHAAPVADSADGLGGAWQTAQHDWRPFGGPDLANASIGFSLSSPVLRMAEGRRIIGCVLVLDGVDVAALVAKGLAFDVYVTGAKGWIGPGSAKTEAAGGSLSLSVSVADTDPAVVDCDAALHGSAYVADGPVVQFVLKTGDNHPAVSELASATVRTARISVDVSGVHSLTLESDLGSLDPKRAFQPFGPQPVAGSRFLVSCPEALSKDLSSLMIRVHWLGLPFDFTSYYDHYNQSVNADTFQATVSFHTAGTMAATNAEVKLFGTQGADGWFEFAFKAPIKLNAVPPSWGRQVRALQIDTGNWARTAERDAVRTSIHPTPFGLRTRAREMPTLAHFLDAKTPAAQGAVTFALTHDFLHATYRRRLTEIALAPTQHRQDGSPIPKDTLQEPYTPTVQGIELRYTASTADIAVSSTSLEDFSIPDVQFFHVDAFGQRRDHGYRRSKIPFLAGTDVPLLPEHPFEGELLIGLDGVAARDSVNLLMQVAEATADPDEPAADVEWAALCDNDWKGLRPEELSADGSNQLRRSGIVTVIVPREATTNHTLMPDGLTWLRAAVRGHSRAACRLVRVAANAVEVARVQPAADQDQQATALPPKSIAKLKTPLTGVKSIDQPYASFDGRPVESADALATRASERLRHKDRAIAPWDYERIVLEHFPGVHRVKCVPHARQGAWLSPGHVLLVVIPDLRDRFTPPPADDAPLDPFEAVPFDLLQPRVDIDTLTRIQEVVRERSGSQIQIHAVNPRYQTIRLSFGVKLRAGYDFNYYRGLISKELVRLLSPWAFDVSHTVTFGGHVYRSALIDFVENLKYVDYVTAFRMVTQSGAGVADVPEAVPRRPDAILVSDVDHDITEVP